MPNNKSSAKRLKTSAAAFLRNRSRKSRVQSARRCLLEAIESGNYSDSDAAFRGFCSELDLAVKQGAIRKNQANRRKSRVHGRVAALQSSAS
jgi:small subunit ribosomal protein S20